MRRALPIVVALAACSSPPAKSPVRSPSPIAATESDETGRRRLIAELQDEILTTYERDDIPDLDTPLIAPQVGPARIGVGPGDVLVADEVRQMASSRWPLFVPPTIPTAVRSKHLDIHLANDRVVSAAWASDEISWRITVCGHVAAIPLRFTALYAHDGDRWVEVFEHLSFARVPEPYFVQAADGLHSELRGREMVRPREQPVVDGKLADELSRVLQALFSKKRDRVMSVVSLDLDHKAEDDPRAPAPTLLIPPDPDGTWHGEYDVGRAHFVDGTLTHEDRRIGTVGPNLARSTIAYWVGNFRADLPARPGIPAGKLRLRGSFVFEKRPNGKGSKWVVVQGHLSEPIDDLPLAQVVFGTSLLAEKPLQVECDAQQVGPTTGAVPGSAPGPATSPAPAAGNR